MLLKVICKCGHIAIVSAESLPRDLRCWRCGTTRHVEARHGRRIKNPVVFEDSPAAQRSRQHQK